MTKYGQLVKLLLGDNAPSDDVIEFYVTSTLDRVKAYCNRSDVPEGLTNTVVEITLDRLTEMFGSKNAKYGDGRKVISGANDGSQSVAYSTPGQVRVVSGTESDFLQGYLTILNSYRTMPGVKPRSSSYGDYGNV